MSESLMEPIIYIFFCAFQFNIIIKILYKLPGGLIFNYTLNISQLPHEHLNQFLRQANIYSLYVPPKHIQLCSEHKYDCFRLNLKGSLRF